MMKKDKTLRIALSSVLLLAVVAAGVTMYRSEDDLKQQEEKKAEEQQMAEDTPLSGLSEGQEDAMESGGEGEPETADVSVDEAQAENTQELDKETSEEAQGQNAPAEEQKEEEKETAEETADTAAPVQPALDFSDDSTMLWPVNGEVLIDYSMDATTYFPTLDLYKYHSAIVLSAAAGDPVQAGSNGQVVSITENEETGTTLTMDLGNGYQAVYGQLKDLTVEEGQVVESGAILGYVNEPTKYYVNEGANLYFAMTKDGAAVDPMIYIETVME